MATLVDIKKQLLKVHYHVSLWQMAEVKELCNVLGEDETIEFATNGHYEGGFALLVSTNHRLILIDKKPMFLTLDSITYSMIQEVLFSYRLLNSTIHIFTSNKSLDFTSWNHVPLRSIFTFTQSKMLGNKTGSALQQAERVQDDQVQPQYSSPVPHEQNLRTSLQERFIEPIQKHLKHDSEETEAPFNEPEVNEQNYEEIPYMPLPGSNSKSTISKAVSGIAFIGSSAIGSLHDDRLAAYKTPSFGQRRFQNRYL